MICEQTSRLFSEVLRKAIPEPALTIAEWADLYRHMAKTDARKGRWKTSVAPYQRGILEAVTDPAVEEVTVMSSAQIGKTAMTLSIVGWFVHVDPSPMLVVQPTLGDAEIWSGDKLTPFIRATPVLDGLFESPRTRDSGNTVLHKQFPGGFVTIVGANSGAGLSGKSVRVLILDELDLFPEEVGSEGDPVALAEKRTTTFPDRKKIKVSTPRTRRLGKTGYEPTRIEAAFFSGDRRKYFVPCPHCGEFILLEWKNLRWDENKPEEDRPETAYYGCPECAEVIEHDHKTDMLARGEWRPTAPFRGRASFHLNELYSPFWTWEQMVADFLVKRKRPSTLRTFVNLSLGEPWNEGEGQPIPVEGLLARREKYAAPVPLGVLILSAGVDVQDNRIEVEIVGWGRDEESWSIDHFVIEGDPSRPDVWRDLTEILTTEFEAEDGRVHKIAAVGIDTGGHHTQQVYRYVRANSGRRVYALKGANTPGKPLASRPSVIGTGPQRVRLYTVGTETAKDTIDAHLKVTEPGPGYCHFPDHYDEAYFQQLRAETPSMHRGHRVWKKVKESARNEALDMRVYAMAALAIFNPRWKKLARRRQTKAAEMQPNEVRQAPTIEESPEAPPPRKKKRSSFGFGGGWVNNW